MTKRMRIPEENYADPSPPSKSQKYVISVDRDEATSSLSHDDYTVAIICALPVEMAAVQAMLESRHSPLPTPPSDHNAYSLGRIGAHNIVIACLPAGVYGTTSAAIVASSLLFTFPSIRFGLMVGIGGGVPSNVVDIRLGDFVVSKPTASFGGVIQFDYGKTVTSGSFHRTGLLNKPPQILLTAMSRLQADHLSSGSSLSDELSSVADKNHIFAYPGRDVDRLFHADYEHAGGVTCEECDAKHLLARVPRPGNLPNIHYGLIASGNQVIKHAGTRDRLARELGVLCVEMEAAGMMDQFPCLVIRGICDYSDSHKQKAWQPYAAATAAAYAKEILKMVPGKQVEKSVLATAATSSNAELVSRVSHWLTPTNFFAVQNDVISKRQEGTGEWLLHSAEYKTWSCGKQRTLFCQGIPGAGKTVMSSIVINDIQMKFGDDDEIGVAYLFCNFKRQSEQTPTDLFASLLKQLVEGQPVLPEAVETLYEHHVRSKTRPMFHELSQVLLQATSRFRRVFWIIDALDECATVDGARDRILREIFRLQKQARISLFVTSRLIPDIQHQFQDELSVEIRASDEDVQRYLAEHMSRLPSCVFQDRELQETIKTEIVRAACGMFLLVQLHIDSLYDKTTRKSIRQALEKLPKGIDELDDAYESAMERITSQKHGFQKLARRVLLWITCTKRPLTTQELRHALAVEPGQPELDEENTTEVTDMVSVCAGLVTIDEESDVIRLVHYTTQDYFQRTQKRWFADAESEVAKICIAYLAFNAFATGLCYTDETFEARLKSNALFLYAACNWGHHTREASYELNETVLDFLENEAKVSSSTQAMTISMKQPGYSQNVPQLVKGVHLAAYFGLTKVLDILLRNGNYPDLQDTYGRTPLSWAAENGQEASVELLLDSDRVDANFRDENGESPLSWAAKKGHLRTVKSLLDRGSEPDIPNASGRTPLSLAAENGHAAVVELLVWNCAEVNSQDKLSMTPLAWAAARGYSTVIQFMLKQEDIYPNSRQHSDQTPLSLAAAEGHAAAVNHLLANLKVDPNSSDHRNRTPLAWAAARGHDAVVASLLENGRVDPDLPDKYGQTPLSLASAEGRAVVARLLLASDRVDPISRSKDGRTPLCFAAMHGHTAVVQLLLAKPGVDPEPQDDCGRTPLLWAAKNGHSAVVKELLATENVNPSMGDKGGRTPLSWARQNGHHALSRLFGRQG
ncbi:unnamed protein product [Penicillium manginii]